MRHRVWGITAGCLVAAPAAAQETSDAALYSALARHDCAIAERDLADVLGPDGFDFKFVSATLTRLMVDGEASMNADGELHLPASLCPPAKPVATPRDNVLAAFAANGCSMDQATLTAAVPDISDAGLRAIIIPMHNAGKLSVEGRKATLADDICPKTE